MGPGGYSLVYVSLSQNYMCHFLTTPFFFLSSRKLTDYDETLYGGSATGWGLTDDHPQDSQKSVFLSCGGR